MEIGSESGSRRLPDYSSMIHTLVPEPFHLPGWIYEEKSGRRMVT